MSAVPSIDLTTQSGERIVLEIFLHVLLKMVLLHVSYIVMKDKKTGV